MNRRTLFRLVGWLAAVVLATGLVIAAVVHGSTRTSEERLGDGVVSASSAREGHPASAALNREDDRAWRPTGGGIGSWWQMRFDEQTEVARITLDQQKGAASVTRAMVSFGDGTRLMASLAAGETEIDFTARSVSVLRITVLARADLDAPVGFARVTLSDRTTLPIRSAPDDVARDAAVDVADEPAVALTDGDETDAGAVWVAPASGDVDLTLTWNQPQEISALELLGAAGGGIVQRGSVQFGPSDEVNFGGVLADASRPTQVAFMPRVVRSLQVRLAAADAQPIRLSALRVRPIGAVMTTPAATSGVRLAQPAEISSTCGAGTLTGAQIVLRCPTSGSIVAGQPVVVVQAPSGTALTGQLWGNDAGEAISLTARPYGTPGAGLTAFDVPMDAVPGGPVTVQVRSADALVAPLSVPLYNSMSRPRTETARPTIASGGRLVYEENFGGPLTVSRSGTSGAFTAAKPEIDGVSDFGDAPFADPAGDASTLSTVDGLLRVDLAPGQDDGLWGGLLGSSRSGGSGFSAEYGYFEARMYAPMATGTWPAFWVLPASNLAGGLQDVAEFDAVELYGHEPENSCSATHHFLADMQPGGETFCGKRFDDRRDAARWHTYAMRVNPGSIDFFVDGKQVASGAQVPGGEEPMFYMLDLAAGGGWPVDLSGSGGREQLYVDWVRVYE